MYSPNGSSIVVGIAPEISDAVLHSAANLARRLDAELVCVCVDTDSVLVEERPDGTAITRVVMPATLDGGPYLPATASENVSARVDEAIEARLKDVLGTKIQWRSVATAGDPADRLASIAKKLDAIMIVIGTRKPGFRGTLREFVRGSVAVRLAHRQHVPILVVPQSPHSKPLPWELS